MRLRDKAESTWAPIHPGRRNDSLKVLTFILRYARVTESTDVRVFAQNPEQWRSATPMEPAQENEFVLIQRVHGQTAEPEEMAA
jgi:hypothetical protein